MKNLWHIELRRDSTSQLLEHIWIEREQFLSCYVLVIVMKTLFPTHLCPTSCTCTCYTYPICHWLRTTVLVLLFCVVLISSCFFQAAFYVGRHKSIWVEMQSE